MWIFKKANNMNKSILSLSLAVALVASASVSANEDDVSAYVSVQTQDWQRGIQVSDDLSASVGVRFDNVLLDGVFFRGDLTTKSLTPLSDSVSVRSTWGLGYKLGLGDLNVQAAVDRYNDLPLYSSDFTEVSLTADYPLLGGTVFGSVAQGITTDVNKDTTAVVGYSHDIVDDLSVSVLARATRHDNGNWWIDEDNTSFTNYEVSATYNLWRNLDVFATYTHGDENAYNLDLQNKLYGGLRYTF